MSDPTPIDYAARGAERCKAAMDAAAAKPEPGTFDVAEVVDRLAGIAQDMGEEDIEVLSVRVAAWRITLLEVIDSITG